MIVLFEATYPGLKTEESATRFLDLLKSDPAPSFVKLIDLYAFAGGDGIRAMIFYSIDEDNESEGYKYVSRLAVKLLGHIEGFKADIRIVYRLAEAINFLGLTQ